MLAVAVSGNQATTFASEMEKWGSKSFSPVKTVTITEQIVEPLYIVAVKMSSGNKTISTRQISDTKFEGEYFFAHETRLKIGAIRTGYGGTVRSTMVNYFGLGLYIAKKSQLAGISSSIAEADEKMKEIHPTLRAGVDFIMMDSQASRESEIYDKVIASIRGQIYKNLLTRLKQVILQNRTVMMPRTKKSLMGQIEKLREINITNDPGIEEELKRFEAIVSTEMLAPLAEELDLQLEVLEDRFGYIREDA